MRRQRSRLSKPTTQNTPNPNRSSLGSNDPLCGIILAGGEGKRLRPFVHLLRQDLLPKQYVNFIGRRSMLEHTLHRAEKLISSERLFTVLNETHLSFSEVNQQISKRASETIVVQPENKETAPGLLLPLMHLSKHYPNSVVAIFPSDHFVQEEEKLMRYVRLAHLLIKNDPTRLVLLGIEPDGEESEYGYIVPEKTKKGAMGPFPVSCFVEKPAPSRARELILNGALWNTMLMVCRTNSLLELFREVMPGIYCMFKRIHAAIGTACEKDVTREIYQQLKPVNFSMELLEPYVRSHPSNLLVIPVRGVLWSDWGTESRVIEVLRRTGRITRLNGLPRASHDPLTGPVTPDVPTKPKAPRQGDISTKRAQGESRVMTRSLF